MSQFIIRFIGACLLLVVAGQLSAQENAVIRSGGGRAVTAKDSHVRTIRPANVLSTEEWRRVDRRSIVA